MKPIHILIILGVALILAAFAYYTYTSDIPYGSTATYQEGMTITGTDEDMAITGTDEDMSGTYTNDTPAS
jgi:hypothetical protein